MNEESAPNEFDMEDELGLRVAMSKLSKELRAMAREGMSENEARMLVDAFETTQRERIRNSNRVNQLTKDGEPALVLKHFASMQAQLEKGIGVSLSVYAEGHPLTQWMLRQKGIGPLIAVRLLAFVDWENSNTPSKVWAFAGLNPSVVWEKGAKRPWNARLKRLCYLIGESFVKNQRDPDAFYPALFAERKRYEWTHNLSGAHKAVALEKTEKVGKSTDAYKWYSGCITLETARMVAAKTWPEEKKPWGDNKPGQGQPMLPPAHVHSRARRWVVKLFLAHVWWKAQEMRPDGPGDLTPYAVRMLPDHIHVIEPPE